jgi:transposase
LVLEEIIMTSLALGVDIAARTFVAAIWTDGRGQVLGSFPNSPEGFARLAALPAIAQAPAVHLVLEPTGGYELPLAHFALSVGWRVSMPNPKQVRDFAKGQGMRAKTDRQDGLMLARFAAEGKTNDWQPLPEQVGELESLQRRKDDVEHLLRQERNRQHALSHRPHQHQAVPSSVERMIGLLEEELAQLEKEIEEHLKRHAELKEAAVRLRSVPGVGGKTVVPLLVVLWRWKVLTGGKGSTKGLTAYLGLDPEPHESGTSVSQAASISRKGDGMVRRRLYMGVRGGVRGTNPLRAFYERLVGRGKKKKVALVAAERKLVIWSWKVFESESVFDPSKCGRFAAT